MDPTFPDVVRFSNLGQISGSAPNPDFSVNAAEGRIVAGNRIARNAVFG
jgi:hypothetical protein